MRLFRLLLFSSFFSLSALFPILGQVSSIVFSHVDVNNGLSDNWIKCIYRDSRGFVWFGTNSGLNRFDGYNFEIFNHDASDSTSIADNAINVISEDKSGNLWVGTRSGISVLNMETYQFSNISLVPSVPLSCEDIAYITAIGTDQTGNILVGTHNGLFFFNNESNSFRHILPDNQTCISELNNITAITHDNSGSFWFGTNNGFIFRFSPHSNSVEKFESYKDNSENGGIITSLFADRNNNLWIGDINGLSLFNTETKSWNSDFINAAGPVFKKLQITCIDQDKDGQIWVSTDGKGVYIINPAGYAVNNVTNLPYVSGTLCSNGVTTLLCDNSGIVWVGTSKKGADFYRKNVKKFRLYRNYPNDNNSLLYNDVDCIAEDYKGNLWIGTNGGGLNYLDRKTNKFTGFTTDPSKKNTLSSNIIVSLFEDTYRKIWIGTYLGGLNCYDPETGKFTQFRHSDADSTTISDDRIWSICEDNRKNLWIATLTSGLNLFDRSTGRFTRFNTQNSPICFNYLNSVTVDENDNLWISSANGLIFFNPSQNSAKCYFHNPDDSSSLSDNQVVSTFRDSRGLFWVCTSNGLNLMDQVKGDFRVFTEVDGLPSNSVLRILEDEHSDLWISTKNGISKLAVGLQEESGSTTFRFTNYTMSDGLQGKEFTETAALAASDGELWFGGPDGLNAFYPLEITDDTSATVLVLTDFRIFNTKIKYGEVINNRVLLEKPVFNTDRVILKYRENSFTIDFVALNYFNPEKNKYSYHLEGFDDKWISTDGNENFAAFSNINNGNYIFRVRATNSDGIWNNDPVEIRIKVLPPFWKSWYAYLFYTLLILSLLAFLRYLILYRERLNMKIEQEQIESQHVHEIDSLKIKFFTNISHEFRTPLTLILSPVEKLLAALKDSPEEKYLRLINQNAKRLLLMVNQLLDFRRLEVQGFGFNPSYGNIISFIGEVVASFEDLGEQKQIRLVFNSDVKELNAWFDRDKIEKIVFNLLSNAFKFTDSNGTVKVSLSFTDKIQTGKDRVTDSQIEIKVEDTGIGIPADKIDKLFSYFYQVNSLSDYQGTGLGLALVKEFVRLHEGEVRVESEIGKGSCFTVILPLRTGASNGNGHEISSAIDPSVQRSMPDHEVQNKTEKKGKIVIAEDNDDLRFYIKDNLHSKYDIFEASNGEEALAIILKVIPDLIISDIVMPVMDGKELCRRVKTDKRICHIPLIIITAHSSEQEQFDSLETGADDFIPKPFSFQVLESKISNFISLARNLRQSGNKNRNVEPDQISIVSLDEQFLNKALSLVEKNMSNVDYTVEEFSNDLGISRTLFYKKILMLTGKPPLEFIRTLRMKRAAQLLEKSQLNVSEVAFKVGYNDPKYFRKHFKSEFGVLPSRFAEKSKSQQQQ
jgi:signal transduction histidine kinase/ligand-binding sensor domain-containing protein/DNA-binding response OmpR family regulator